MSAIDRNQQGVLTKYRNRYKSRLPCASTSQGQSRDKNASIERLDLAVVFVLLGLCRDAFG